MFDNILIFLELGQAKNFLEPSCIFVKRMSAYLDKQMPLYVRKRYVCVQSVHSGGLSNDDSMNK